MTATAILRPGRDEAADPNSSPTAHIEALFDDNTRVSIFINDGTPDEDGAISYVVAVTGADEEFLYYDTELWSGDDGQVDYTRALYGLIDIWTDYGAEAEFPESYGNAFIDWIDDHAEDLVDLHDGLAAQIHNGRPFVGVSPA